MSDQVELSPSMAELHNSGTSNQGNTRMKGQWIGTYTGSHAGTIIVNIDELPDNFEGVAYLFSAHPHLANIAFYIKSPNKQTPCEMSISRIERIDNQTADLVSSEHPLPTTGTLTAAWNADSLKLSWQTNVPFNGQCELLRSKATERSALQPVPNVTNWSAYKFDASNLDYRRYIYRGQKDATWRLRTRFHRTGRTDLKRYYDNDIPDLYRHLSGLTRYVFRNENRGDDFVLLNLAQHHGYPTPLLDWSYSPYVAAFFAYRTISQEDLRRATTDSKVRIYRFDKLQWEEDFFPLPELFVPGPNFSIFDLPAIENPRMIPQQALTILSNIDDIETFIQNYERTPNRYLSAVDLPVAERSEVMRDLSSMGITAGSLFPGLDGACEELRERHFG